LAIRTSTDWRGGKLTKFSDVQSNQTEKKKITKKMQKDKLCLTLLLLVTLLFTPEVHADLTTAAIGATEYANKVALYTAKNFFLYWNADKAANVSFATTADVY